MRCQVKANMCNPELLQFQSIFNNSVLCVAASAHQIFGSKSKQKSYRVCPALSRLVVLHTHSLKAQWSDAVPPPLPGMLKVFSIIHILHEQSKLNQLLHRSWIESLLCSLICQHQGERDASFVCCGVVRSNWFQWNQCLISLFWLYSRVCRASVVTA